LKGISNFTNIKDKAGNLVMFSPGNVIIFLCKNGSGPMAGSATTTTF